MEYLQTSYIKRQHDGIGHKTSSQAFSFMWSHQFTIKPLAIYLLGLCFLLCIVFVRVFIYMTYRRVMHTKSFMLAQAFEDRKFNNGAKYSSFSQPYLNFNWHRNVNVLAEL